MTRSRAADAGLALDCSVPRDLPVLRCDERALKQMLVNLLSNAIKFTPEGGQVTLDAAVTADGGMAIAVRDTGVGLAEEQIARALEPFGQIQNSLDRAHEGTGLGLPLVKALIEAHGGRLEIESAPGSGTTTRLVFPADRLRTAAPAARKTPARRPRSGGRKR